MRSGTASSWSSCRERPDVLLGRCTREQVGEEILPLDEARRSAVLAANEALAGEALRTLGVAFRPLPDGSDVTAGVDEEVEQDLVFLGLIGMIDPPRAEARTAIAQARAAGVRVIMITGDHPRTAAVIAAELGITEDNRAVTGAELTASSQVALEQMVREVSVYARVNPDHKIRIVRALQKDEEA